MSYQQFLDPISRFNAQRYRDQTSGSAFKMASSGSLTIDYAPFDHIETGAELAIVGLTPGRTQATNALAAFSQGLKRGLPIEEAMAQAKRVASFSGPMRANLLAMLDAIGVPAIFGRKDAAEFFSSNDGLVHFTSALRYPVYIDGKNYSGSPAPLKHPLLKNLVETCLAEEAAALKNTVWIPLGPHAEAALLHLTAAKQLDRVKVLAGLPHPSGANAERIAYFLGRKDAASLSAKTNALRIDEAKGRLLAQMSQLRR